MDQLVSYAFLFAAVGVIFASTSYYATESVGTDMLSQHDKTEIGKRQNAEYLKQIDISTLPDFKVEIMNTGLEEITVKGIFVDGIRDLSFQMSDRYDAAVTTIEQNKIITIKPSLSGSKIILITDNNKSFTFE